MTFALLAAFALPVATTPMFGKDPSKRKAKKAKRGKKGKRQNGPA